MKKIAAILLLQFVIVPFAFAQGTGTLFGGQTGMGTITIWDWLLVFGGLALFYILYRNHGDGQTESNLAPSKRSRQTKSRARAPAAKSAVAKLKEQKPVKAFSDSGPIKGFSLKRKRGERKSALGKVIFTLDARIDVSAENRALIQKYKLGGRVIYESANRQKYRNKALRHVGNTRDQPGFFASGNEKAWGIAKTLGSVGAAAVHATVSALSLRITVNSLMKGVHIECKDAAELMEAESAILEATKNLKTEIEVSTSFSGEESVIEI